MTTHAPSGCEPGSAVGDLLSDGQSGTGWHRRVWILFWILLVGKKTNSCDLQATSIALWYLEP